MPEFATEALAILVQVVMIDLVLAGDNAVVIGMAAAGLPREQRARAVLVGVAAAAVLRVAFALFTTQLLAIVGLLFAGGLVLLWVSWRMFRELRASTGMSHGATGELGGFDIGVDGAIAGHASHKTFAQAAGQIVIADVSMSLDNVLAVAGAAHDHLGVLVVGLGLSIALMGFAATLIAGLLQRHRWIAYLGLAMILYVALHMIYRGAGEILLAMNGSIT
jgi:YjbE family integral membrane protein